jgi:hypothetical protein
MDLKIITDEEYQILLRKLEIIEQGIENIKHPKKEVYSHDEFCELFSISRRTSQAWRDKGLIKPIKIGGKLIYTQEVIKAFLQKHDPNQLK